MKRLTAKDRLFCFEYLADEKLNPERAAIKVGYSPTVARNKAYVWVSNSQQNPKPQIKAFIDEMMIKREQELGITIERLIKEHGKIAFSNPCDIIDKMGGHINLKLLKELSEAERASIQEISETEVDGVTTRKIKMYNKQNSLDSLSKIIKPELQKNELVLNLVKDNKVIETITKEF